MPALAYLSDDPDEIRAALDAARARRDIAEAAMLAADTGDEADWPALEAADTAFHRADRELALLACKIDELEAEAAWDEMRDLRRGFGARVL